MPMSMSKWTHAMCSGCWVKERGLVFPNATIPGDKQVCCFCGDPTSEGIFVREEPERLRCGGRHAEV